MQARGYFDLRGLSALAGNSENIKYTLFPASDHVCDDQGKPMAAECHEHTILIKYTPHAACELILHIFPPLSTWVEVLAILHQASQ